MSNNNDNRADYAPSEKKVWKHAQIEADPHRINHFYSIQELQGAHVWDDEKQKTVWEEAEEPRSTRVVLMEMGKDGFAKNVNSASYNGPRRYTT
jgi:hypothetical protein